MPAAFLLLLRSLALICGGHRTVALEDLALRQQLAMFKRTNPRPPIHRRDRLFWLLLSQEGDWRVRPSTISAVRRTKVCNQLIAPKICRSPAPFDVG
jgi:hypothetical protein